MARLELNNLTKKFGDLIAVNDLNLEVRSEEFLCLLGPSGCGKTTTMNMIAGLLKPTSGTVFIDDVDVTHVPPGQRGVGLVFQDYAVFYHMSVYDNISFGLKVRKISSSEIEKEVEKVAKLLHLGKEIMNKRGKELSLELLQKVALARTLIIKPAILLLDEPLSNLDALLRIRMRAELKKLQKELKQTVLYVTHDQLEAMTLADRIAIMDRGELQQAGTQDEIYNLPRNRFVANFVGSPTMNFVDCTFVERNGKAFLQTGTFTLDVSNIRDIIRERATGSELTIGIRPEDITITRKPIPKKSIEATVDLTEPLGYKAAISLRVGGNVIMAVTSPTFKVDIDDRVWIELPIDKMHIIDRKTGLVI